MVGEQLLLFGYDVSRDDRYMCGSVPHKFERNWSVLPFVFMDGGVAIVPGTSRLHLKSVSSH